MTKELFWEKYRPKTIEECVLPDRLRKIFNDGIVLNMILYGDSGLGKSTVASILTNKIGNPEKVLRLSKKIGVEEIRNVAQSFCRRQIIDDDNISPRVIWFEEFDRTKKDVQDELKTFIEDNHKRVRFIATTNYISDIDTTVLSRFEKIDFTPRPDETKDLLNQFYKKIVAINESDNLGLTKDQIKSSIKNNFPDYRSIWNSLQASVLGFEEHITDTKPNIELYNIIFDSSKKDNDIFDYLVINYDSNPNQVFHYMQRQFYRWMQENLKYKTKLFDIMNIVSEYTELKRPNAVDPLMCAFIMILNIRKEL